ncbi:hypothetical protein H4582DRAFT_2074405 [Lactarius indigo]|nr:hypothetical protein H4582DRAFT_2074405 [Lactarius indigo]
MGVPPPALPASFVRRADVRPALYHLHRLPTFVENGIFDSSQALLVAHALADLRAQEVALDNPARIGHRIVQPGGGAGYQDELVAFLRVLTESWREFATREIGRLDLAWLKMEMLGKDEVHKWLDAVKRGDEAEWVDIDLVVRLVEWYQEQGRG